MSILKVEHLKKVYTTRFGGQQVQALSRRELLRGGGRIRGHHGRVAAAARPRC